MESGPTTPIWITLLKIAASTVGLGRGFRQIGQRVPPKKGRTVTN